MRVAFFTDMPEAIHIAMELKKQGLLALCIVPDRNDLHAQILERHLESLQIPTKKVSRSRLPELDTVLAESKIDCGLLFFFQYVLPEVLLESCPMGFYNLHPSPLPSYRGADPMFWQLKNGERQSAVVLHRIDKGVDTGPVLDSIGFEIRSDDTHNTLRNSAVYVGYEMVKTFSKLIQKAPKPQSGQPSYAPIPKERDYTVDWKQMDGESIERLCRAANPIFGGAKTSCQGHCLGIMQSTCSCTEIPAVEPGTIIGIDEKDGIITSTLNGTLNIEYLYTEDGFFGGARFANRFGLNPGMSFFSGDANG